MPDAAAADHRDAVARPHARGAPDRAGAGRHGAAGQRGDLERHAVGDRDAAGRRHDRALGERGQERVVVDRLAARARAAACPSSSPPWPIPSQAVVAEVRQPAQALVAAAARRHPGEHHARARRASAARSPDRLDHARALVAEHRRAAGRRRAVDRVVVGVADAAGVQPHEHLARARAARARGPSPPAALRPARGRRRGPSALASGRVRACRAGVLLRGVRRGCRGRSLAASSDGRCRPRVPLAAAAAALARASFCISRSSSTE